MGPCVIDRGLSGRRVRERARAPGAGACPQGTRRGEASGQDGRRRRREWSWIWGMKWPWGRTNPVVKSEVPVARSRKGATATLATTRSGIHATATPFSFSPFSFSFLHILFFFLSPYSISFIFNYVSICFPFNFISSISSEFRLKRAATKKAAVARFVIGRYYYV